MIACIFHEGSGLGNQLARYVAVRCLALDKGYEFGVINPENFKGKDFMNLDMGVPVHDLLYEFHEEKVVNEHGNDVRPYDHKILEVKDNTILDGEFQDERYFIHHLDKIGGWLNFKTNYRNFAGIGKCVINFRGGEYVGVPDLFLPKEYWNKAIEIMKDKVMGFEVVTDDVDTAKKFFPEFPISHGTIEEDWTRILTAKELIISNSSFAILPALLNQFTDQIIAPKYWAGYNKGYWQLPQNRYSKFTYIHHNE